MNHHTHTGRAARTMRESCGTFLSPEAFEALPAHNPDRPVIIGSLVIAGLMVGLWAGGTLKDRFDMRDTHTLRQHGCSPVDSLVSDRDVMLWHCRDGYRLSSTDVVDGN